jgi:hypothetical protein
MIKNPAQKILHRKSLRWLLSLSPLVVPLVVLILPAVAPTSFAANAQVVEAPCRWPDDWKNCVYSPEGLRYFTYLDNLVYRWMKERGLPPEALNRVIRKYGREDLVADINAYIAAEILLALEKPAEKRTEEEKLVVGALERDISRRELALYDYAVKDAESFIRNPCEWKPDPDIAAAYGLEYDGTPYCYNRGPGVFFRFHIPGPDSAYLYAAAYRNAYGYPGEPLVAMLMQEKVGVHLGATAAAIIPGGVAGGIVGKNISKFVSIFEAYLKSSRIQGEVAKQAFKLRYTRFIGGGAFSIVSFMANIGIEAIIAFAAEVKFQQDLDNFRATRDRIAAGVNTMDILTADKGLEKAMLVISSYGVQTGREPLPKHRPGVDRGFIVREGTVTRPRESLSLKDHADQLWTVQMWENWFVRSLRYDDGTTVESITPELEVTDHQGIQWLATRIGPDRFRMTQVRPREDAVVCPTYNGISKRQDASCSMYYSNSINIKLKDGQNVAVNLGVAPRIESSESYFFPARTQTSFPIQVTGQPAPILQARNLPSWLQLVNGNLVGNPERLAGKAQIELTVQTPSGSDRKSITIYHGEPVQFMSSTSVEMIEGQPLEFTINVAGTPRPKITLTGWLPPFVSFRDNGNGTATLSGMWGGGFPPISPCFAFLDTSGNLQNQNCPPTITASNGAQTVGQMLGFGYRNKPAPPSARFEGPTELKFRAGVESRYVLTSSGARTPVEWRNLTGQRLRDDFARSLPWLRFDERPDGTADVFGIPPMNGQSSTTAFNACPYARESQLMNCGSVEGNLRITVDAETRFMSDPFGSVVTGRNIDIPVFVNRFNGQIGFSPWHILTSRFPKGMRLEPAPPHPSGMVMARITGSPERGQGGRYEFMLNWTDQLSSLNSLFSLDVLEPASITGPDTFTFFEGSKAEGQVTTQGYPVNSAGIDCGPGKDCADMSIRLEWGPRKIEGLTLTDRTPQGVPTGVGRFSGVIPPGAGGVYEAFIVASNGGMAPAARKPVRLIVRSAGDLNGDGKVDCLDLTSLKNAFGNIPFIPGQGFDLTGDMLVDDKDIEAMVRAVRNLWACLF